MTRAKPGAKPQRPATKRPSPADVRLNATHERAMRRRPIEGLDVWLGRGRSSPLPKLDGPGIPRAAAANPAKVRRGKAMIADRRPKQKGKRPVR